MSRQDIKSSDSISQMGYNGQGAIRYPVKGWGENECLKLKVEHKTSWRDEAAHWEIELEVPRWGRDDEVDAVEAYTDLHEAMAEAIVEMKRIKDNEPELEKHRKKGVADRIAKEEAERAERQAKIDADKPVGMPLAKMICDQMVKQARDTKEDSQSVKFQTRGDRRDYQMRCVYTYTGLTLFNCGYSRISRKDAMAKLADAFIDTVDTGDVADSIPNAKMAGFMMGGLNK